MSKKSDYTHKRLNLNDFLPAINKNEFVESFNENTFNRFLTKSEFDHIVGIIGKEDLSTAINRQIVEQDAFRQDNQLQPVVKQTVGTANHFMSFYDFLKRLDRMGVNVDRFNEWGSSLHFNYAPPICMDKLINYRNYYWDTTQSTSLNNTPEYITIKNLKNWAYARYDRVMRNIINATPETTISGHSGNVLHLTGNATTTFTVGVYIIIQSDSGKLSAHMITSSAFNISANRTEVGVDGDITFVPVSTFLCEIPTTHTDTTFTITGDYTSLIVKDYVVAATSNTTNILHLFAVVSSTYNTTTNKTSVTVDRTTTGHSFSKLKLHIVLLIMQKELQFHSDPVHELTTEWVDSYIGSALAFNKFKSVEGTVGSTVWRNDTFTDTTRNFTAANVTTDHKLVILDGKGVGEYEIKSVGVNTLVLKADNLLFTANNIGYFIYRPPYESPAAPAQYELWLNTGDNTISQYDGMWHVKVENTAVLHNLHNVYATVDHTNTNDWSDSNHWVHRSSISDFTGKIKANLPIIEYSPHLELSEASFSTKSWKYRKSKDVPYRTTDTTPKMIELHDIRITNANQHSFFSEFNFTDTTTIILNQKFGNLTDELVDGYKIRLSEFDSNNGTYEVAKSTYEQDDVTGTSKFTTRIKLKTPLFSITDKPENASIQPQWTSAGDPFISVEMEHWQFAGIKDIRESSFLPEPNPMLDIIISNWTDGVYQSTIGMCWQSFALVDGQTPKLNPTFLFDVSLHDLVLYDDYQEGDIRVYVNGIRQYGNFEDIGSTQLNFEDYVGGIRFTNRYITDRDVVRIELGEYALSDIGKRAVHVKTETGYELYNLTDVRKIEQHKTENNQYPLFSIFDIFGNGKTTASAIFKFVESEDAKLNPHILKRIVKTGVNYNFEQLLSDPVTNEVFSYKNYSEIDNNLQTIWKRGLNYETYVPLKSYDLWQLAYQWYYNNAHELRSHINLTEIYSHYFTIIAAQAISPEFGSKDVHLLDKVNYGVGGTIKEFNDGFDTLMSAIFVDNGDPIRIIQFAHDQYMNSISRIREHFIDKIHTYILESNGGMDLFTLASGGAISAFENDDKLDQLFGDSTSYDESIGIGIRNWIATLPQFKLMPRVKPYIIKDDTLAIHQLVHHDGHRSNIQIPSAVREQMFVRILKAGTSIKQTIIDDSDPFPTQIAGDDIINGWLVLRTNTTESTRKLFIYNDDWYEINLSDMYGDVLLAVERKLYESIVEI